MSHDSIQSSYIVIQYTNKNTHKQILCCWSDLKLIAVSGVVQASSFIVVYRQSIIYHTHCVTT